MAILPSEPQIVATTREQLAEHATSRHILEFARATDAVQ
jgi:hypothetical protein